MQGSVTVTDRTEEQEQKAKWQLESFSQLPLNGAGVMGTKVSSGFRECVVPTNDEITLTIKSDQLLLIFGEH